MKYIYLFYPIPVWTSNLITCKRKLQYFFYKITNSSLIKQLEISKCDSQTHAQCVCERMCVCVREKSKLWREKKLQLQQD